MKPNLRFNLLLLLLALPLYSHDSVFKMDEALEKLYGEDVREITKPRVYKNGILFTYAGNKGDSVAFGSDFTGWDDPRSMYVNDLGIYYLFLPVEVKAGTYKYRFKVNGLWLNDPLQSLRVQDPFGSPITALVLEEHIEKMLDSPKVLPDGRLLFFLKDDGYESVAFVGTVNKWDPYSLYMELENGYWRITLSAEAGKQLYRFRVDGKEILDPENPIRKITPFGGEASWYALP